MHLSLSLIILSFVYASSLEDKPDGRTAATLVLEENRRKKKEKQYGRSDDTNVLLSSQQQYRYGSYHYARIQHRHLQHRLHAVLGHGNTRSFLSGSSSSERVVDSSLPKFFSLSRERHNYLSGDSGSPRFSGFVEEKTFAGCTDAFCQKLLHSTKVLGGKNQGIFVRSALWMNYKSIMPTEDDTSSVVFCALSSAWTQYFYMATWIWTLCYAYDMKLLLGERPGYPSYYHAVAWICPAVLTTFGLTLLYIPDANCHNLTSLSTAILRILPNYCATYVLLAVVMIVNPALYVASTKDLQNAVNCSLSQITGRERKLVQTIRLKFALTNIVYYICWIPNLINGILLWTLWFQLPVKVIITLWYIMAVTNPLQAFFNALVYQRWGKREKLRTSWCLRQLGFNRTPEEQETTEISESSPLLSPKFGCTPHTSINGSSSL